jgi:catalase
VPDFIIDRQLAHFDLIAREYGDGVRAARAALAAGAADTISQAETVAAE